MTPSTAQRPLPWLDNRAFRPGIAIPGPVFFSPARNVMQIGRVALSSVALTRGSLPIVLCASHPRNAVGLYSKGLGIFNVPRFWDLALAPKKLARRQRNTPACQGWSRSARWRDNWEVGLSLFQASIRLRVGRNERCLARSNSFRAGFKPPRTAHPAHSTVYG